MISNVIDTLSIHINVDGFSFYYFEKELPFVAKKDFFIKPNASQDYAEQLITSVQKENVEQFSTIRLIFSNPSFTLIPNEIYDENRISDYLEFNNFVLTNDPIESKLIKDLNIRFLYSYLESLETQIKNAFPEKKVKLLHSGYSLINQLSKFSPEIDFFVWFNFSSIEILYFNNKQLIFYNFFETASKEDILYYILFVAEQLEIDVNEKHFCLLGNTTPQSETISMMKKYIRHVKIGVNENNAFKNFLL